MELFRKGNTTQETTVGKEPERQLNRPGTPFVELPPDKIEAAEQAIERSRLQATVANDAHKILERTMHGDSPYRAPELKERQPGQPEFEATLLRKLIQDGRVNFADASFDVSKELLNERAFSDQDVLNYAAAAQAIESTLGLEEQIVSDLVAV